MKITKTIQQVNAEKMTREQANTGCYKCPNCGEDRDFFKCIGKGGGGVMSTGYRTKSKGFLALKMCRIDTYVCQTCGVAWESEPYEV